MRFRFVIIFNLFINFTTFVVFWVIFVTVYAGRRTILIFSAIGIVVLFWTLHASRRYLVYKKFLYD